MNISVINKLWLFWLFYLCCFNTGDGKMSCSLGFIENPVLTIALSMLFPILKYVVVITRNVNHEQLLEYNFSWVQSI